MNWQTWATIIAVGTASVFIAGRIFRSMTARAGGCGHGCGGSSKPDLGIERKQIISIDDLTNKTHGSAK